jgi:DNA repair photolyase
MELIKPFDPWGSSLCSCPAKYSLSAYTGCNHGCLYCYASSYIRNFKHVRPKKDFLIRLKREIKKIPSSSHITLANSSDPYLSLEKKLKLTRKALRIINDYDVRISLVTKSALITRDLDILKKTKQAIACITITTLDEACAKKLESHASTPKERLAAVKKLSRVLPVAVRLDPLIYPLTTQNLKKTICVIAASGARQVITSTYKIKPDNYQRMLNVYPGYRSLWQELYFEKGEKQGSYRYMPLHVRKPLLEDLRGMVLKYKMEFSTCREGLANLNTNTCDASGAVSRITYTV